LTRSGIPIQHLPSAAQVRELLLRFKLGVDVGIGQINLADDTMRKSVLVGDRLQPARLVERACQAPIGGHVHGLRYALRHDVVDPLLHRIVAAQAEIVAEHARDRRIGQPRYVFAQPDVMMGVDHRSAVRRHGFSLCIQ
jgi:hypothetical protein